MKLEAIGFENYKVFSEKQIVKIRPITMLIGKNSSGKSSIAKLFPLFENSLSGNIDEPLLIKNNGVELGSDFRDLVSHKDASPVVFYFHFEQATLEVSVFKSDDTHYETVIQKWKYNDFELTLSSRNFYTDKEGNKYWCKFKGFVLQEAKNELGEIMEFDFNLNLKITVDYIGPFRVLPERIYTLTGQIFYDKIGIRGENAYPILGSSKRLQTALCDEVAEWYEMNFDGWRLITKDSNPYIEINLRKGNNDINLVDVGQGMNQALPLVVRAFHQDQDSIIVVEQPELHLHPAAHGEIAELFARSAINNNQSYLIETHSENFILRLRKLIVSNSFGFTKDDFVLYFINDENELIEITVDENAILSDWPEGVFSEHIREILEIEKAIETKVQS